MYNLLRFQKSKTVALIANSYQVMMFSLMLPRGMRLRNGGRLRIHARTLGRQHLIQSDLSLPPLSKYSLNKTTRLTNDFLELFVVHRVLARQKEFVGH